MAEEIKKASPIRKNLVGSMIEMNEFPIQFYDPNDPQTETLYQVVGKLDADAPDGFKDNETTKVIDPQAGSNTINLAVWDEARNQYDTGLNEFSAQLRRTFPDVNERKEVLKVLEKYLVVPVENQLGEGVLNPRNLEFWDNQMVTITRDVVFSNKEPLEMLALYSLILLGNIAPKEQEDSPKFRNKAQFCVENKAMVLDLKHKKAVLEVEAIGLFHAKLKNNRDELITILDWLKVITTKVVDDSILSTTFLKWLKDKEDKYQNPKIFSDACKHFETPAGKTELEMYYQVRELSRRGIIKYVFGRYELEGEILGNTIQEAAKTIKGNRALAEMVLEKME
jgi:hypothetical protein